MTPISDTLALRLASILEKQTRIKPIVEAPRYCTHETCIA